MQQISGHFPGMRVFPHRIFIAAAAGSCSLCFVRLAYRIGQYEDAQQERDYDGSHFDSVYGLYVCLSETAVLSTEAD